MPRKRKSVTFHDNVSMISPKTFDGSFSPAPNTTTPATAAQPLRLDPMYVSWLRSATRVHFPFILNGTFATHVYRQHFDEHAKIKTVQAAQRAQGREAAVPPLAEKYGSLGWGNLYREVSENAWVKNYREIYRFDGSDESLLEKMAQAYDELCGSEAGASVHELIGVQIKHAIAGEENAHAQFTHDESINGSASDRIWEPVTQGGGTLTSPNLGLGGVNMTFGNMMDAPFDEDESVRFGADNREGNRNETSLGRDVMSRDFGDAMMNARTGPRMLSAGPAPSNWGYQPP